MPRISIRVRPTNSKGRFLTSKDAEPWADVVGTIGNSWVDRTLDRAEIETLHATGIFEFRDPPPERTGEVVRLIGRDARRDVVKLVCDGGDDGAA